MKTMLIMIIRAYKVVLSPVFGNCCRYYPSCSDYGITAIEKHGCIRGALLSVWRILRCNPFNNGGVDLVPEVKGSD